VLKNVIIISFLEKIRRDTGGEPKENILALGRVVIFVSTFFI
jgi:hypothetical protein